MVEAAIRNGLTAIGFSGHGFTLEDSSYCMSKQNTCQYVSEITKLKREYEGKIDILCGLEADLNSEFDKSLFDYVIGSVHYFSYGDIKLNVDNSISETKRAIEYYGSPDKTAEVYYSNVKKLKAVTDCDIIGHFDIITKFEDKEKLFDTDGKYYIDLALDAVDALVDTGVVFEINTGAMARGYRQSPYPAPFILKRIKEKGGSIILNGDAHSATTLCYRFDTALEYVKSVGFTSVKTLTKNGFADVII